MIVLHQSMVNNSPSILEASGTYMSRYEWSFGFFSSRRRSARYTCTSSYVHYKNTPVSLTLDIAAGRSHRMRPTPRSSVRPRMENPSRASSKNWRFQAPHCLSSLSFGHVPIGTLTLRSVTSTKPASLTLSAAL